MRTPRLTLLLCAAAAVWLQSASTAGAQSRADPAPAVSNVPATPNASGASGGVRGSVTIIEKKFFGSGPKEDRSGVVVSAEPVTKKLAETVRQIGEANRSKTAPVVDIAQKKKQFAPVVTSIYKGDSVAFKNYDHFFHNVFSLSGANKFDIGHKKGTDEGPSRDVITFNTAGKVELFCDIHQQMFGLLYVLDTPFHTITKDDGTFELQGMPRGDYTIRFQLEGADDVTKTVTVGAQPEKIEATISQIRKTNARAKDHTRKDGSSYSATADDLY